MSKMYVTSGTGSQQTLSDIQNEKIPIYDSHQDAESDLANLAEGQLVATKDNGNNNRYVLQSEYNSNNTYSTSEVDTGKTWIDGKKIYRKFIEYPNGTPVSFMVPLSNLDKIIDYHGEVTLYWSGSSTLNIVFPFAFSDGYGCLSNVAPSHNGVYLYLWKDGNKASTYLGFWIEYTKTV